MRVEQDSGSYQTVDSLSGLGFFERDEEEEEKNLKEEDAGAVSVEVAGGELEEGVEGNVGLATPRGRDNLASSC